MRISVLALLFLAVPTFASASVTITEVYADATGSDEGKEWVEVKNNGTTAVAISDIVFVENGQQHTLESAQGSTTLAPGGVLIIVDDLSGFLSVVTGYSGQVADSTWGSLTNTGEVLSVQVNGVTDDTTTYTAASAEGTSVSRSGSSWASGTPTPGIHGSVEESTPESTATVVSTTTPTSVSVTEKPRQVIMHIPQQVIAGLSTELSADMVNGSSMSDAFTTYTWSLGNGATRTGRTVKYRFPYAGTFSMSIVARVGNKTYKDVRTISVVEPAVSLLRSGPEVIVVTNTSEELFDLSGWHIIASGVKKTFDEGMMLPPATSVSLARNELGMPYAEGETIELHLPLGGVVSRIVPQQAVEESIAEPALVAAYTKAVLPKLPNAVVTKTSTVTEEPEDRPLVRAEMLSATAGTQTPIPSVIWLVGLLLAGGGIVVLSERYL